MAQSSPVEADFPFLSALEAAGMCIAPGTVVTLEPKVKRVYIYIQVIDKVPIGS